MTGPRASNTDPLAVDISEIPLPPEELTDALDNTPATEAAEGKAQPAPPQVAELDFLSLEKLVAIVPLDHPFRLDGRKVCEIRVRKLTVAQVAELTARAGSTGFDLYDVYAVMTGLPAPVLRGLVDDDGEAVIGKAYDFLPRAFRTEGG
jgi:hypothetical protein